MLQVVVQQPPPATPEPVKRQQPPTSMMVNRTLPPGASAPAPLPQSVPLKEPTPVPRQEIVKQVPPVVPWQEMVKQVPQMPPPVPIAASGSPAYRWYGYGTITPGANPYAPAGTPPTAPAGWLSQTGATPGAFPVPTVNPFRPTPGAEPANYVAAKQVASNTPARPAPQSPAVVSPNSMRRGPVMATSGGTIQLPAGAGQPTPTVGPKPTGGAAEPRPDLIPRPPLPPIRWQPDGVPLPAEADVTLSKRTEPAPLPLLDAAQRPQTIARAQAASLSAPTVAPQTVADCIRAACVGKTTALDIRLRDTTRLAITLRVRTAEEAEPLVNEISKLPELKPYTVDFEVHVGP
jgi:hypothetical protein